MQIKLNSVLYNILFFKESKSTYKNVERPSLTFYANSIALPLSTLQSLISNNQLGKIILIDGNNQTVYENYTIVNELSQKYDKEYCITADDNITVLSLTKLTDDEINIKLHETEISALKMQLSTQIIRNAYLESAQLALQAYAAK